MNAVRRYELVVVGGGMVGLAAAALGAAQGFRVAVIESNPYREFDASADVGLRVSALSPGSAAILDAAGSWSAITGQRHCAYRQMRIEDATSGASLEFTAPSLGLERLGTIVENDLVVSALWNVVEGSNAIDVYAPDRLAEVRPRDQGVRIDLVSGVGLHGELLVGADGAGSAVRSLIGADSQAWHYNQQGLVCRIRTAERNPGIAWQRFLPGGPLAFLPLQDGQSSLVWSLPDGDAKTLRDDSDERFLERLDAASDGWLGQVSETGPRACFRLGMRLDERIVAGCVVLLGDAAHLVHPLAGQGANLGLADAAALVQTLVESRRSGCALADRRRLRAFDRWRRSENDLMAVGIHTLGALFRPEALAPLRRRGMQGFQRSWWLSDAFVRRAAGLGPNAPRLALGLPLEGVTSDA